MRKRTRWPRNEPLYNKIQESEFLNFFEFVRHLTNYVCKEKKMKQMIQCLLIWRKFPNLSVRRARGFLLLLKKFSIITVDIPCFKTLSNYNENNSLGIILDKLIEESSKPLSVVEHDFATDATGIRTKLFSTWYSLRCKKEIKKRDHLTIHITTGVKSNIITALNVEIKSGNDNKIFREHVDKTAKNFKCVEFSGDGKYWCKENCRKSVEVGAKPYFKVWKNWSGNSRGCMSWKKMNLEFEKNSEEYGKHYHKRSNVESTNHSKKVLHGNSVYSRLQSARINEETLRWINHNINVLNRARHQWNIIPKFMA
ncbi:MAG: transposase [Nanoarchaeota archaeon]